jgi:ribosome-binding protein aMBF1 (putative translation factor)
MRIKLMVKRLKHINRPMTEEEREQAAIIREGAQQDFPPKTVVQEPPSLGLPARIYEARRLRGMTRYEIGQIAHVPATIVRAIEEGHDVPLSQFHAVVAALGMTIELVEQA